MAPSTTPSPAAAAAALRVFTEIAEAREAHRATFNCTMVTSDNEINDSPCPVFDAHYAASGADGIQRMINFTPRQFHTLWIDVADFINRRWNVGRGRKCAQTAKDVLFMVLVVLKHGGTWDVLGAIFGIKGPTFEKMITAYLRTLSPFMYDQEVSKLANDLQMEGGARFVHFPAALYATDVTFQHANRPSGNTAEGKVYYSRKHKLYGLKTEVSVIADGRAIDCTPHYAGSFSDIDIFRKNSRFHEQCLRKADNESTLPDNCPLKDKYPDHWAVLVDKGYQGLTEIVRAIHPTKKKPNTRLSPQEVAFNRTVASDRIIVENFFGRLCVEWGICAVKFRWAEDLYDPIFRLCVALTNLGIKYKPLRCVDSENYNQHLNQLFHIGDEISKKKAESARKYRLKAPSHVAGEVLRPIRRRSLIR